MVVADRGRLVGSLRSITIGSLRVIAAYTDEGYEPLYVRDDVTPRLSEFADEIHDDLILQGLGREYLEDLFVAGDLHCSVHCFEELTAFHFAGDGFAGLFVSVDAESNVPLTTFVEECKQSLRS